MDIAPLSWNGTDGWQPQQLDFVPGLVLYFGSRATLDDSERFQELRERFPDACLLGCSTDAQIQGGVLVESGISGVAIRFEATTIRAATAAIGDPARSHACGEAIGPAPAASDLAGLLVLADGMIVNGSDLVEGIARHVGNVPIFGGLADAELGPELARIGFYSYGELSPHATSGRSELHNQTMTVTTMTER